MYNKIYLERDYCEKCGFCHWVEKYFDVSQTKIKCHGRDLKPEDTATHYVTSAKNGGKGFYLNKKSKWWKPKPQVAQAIPLPWQLAKDAELPAEVDF